MSTNTIQILGKRFVVRETYYASPAVGTLLARGDALRAYLGFAAFGAHDALVTTDPQCPAGKGATVSVGGGLLEFKFKDHGALCLVEWYAGNNLVGFDITVFEIDYHEDW